MRNRPEILYEDEFLIIINKPSGLLSIPDRYRKDIPSAYTIFNKQFTELHIVHRIDKETSGCLVFAKDAETHRTLNQLFEQRAIEKTYLALVHGAMIKQDGIIDLPIASTNKSGGKMKVDKRGKASQTEYELIQRFPSFSWIKIRLHTGRTHQIRLHFSHIGHPLCGDQLYGKSSEVFLSTIKGKKYRNSKNTEEQPILQRCALHASSLEFIHPMGEQTIRTEAPLPKDLKAILNQLHKWSKIK